MRGGRDVSGLALAFLPLLPLGALVCVWGALRPLYHTAIHQAIDDADRTTLVSAENLLANLLEAVVILPIAAVQDRLGLLAAFAAAVRPPCPLRSAVVLLTTDGRFRFVSCTFTLWCAEGGFVQAPLIFVTYAGLALAVRLGRKTKAD